MNSLNISSVAVSATINYLKSIPALSQKTIVPEYDSNITPIAINDDPVISVGVEQFNAGPSLYTQNSTGHTVGQGTREYKLKMRIRFYVSFSNGAQRSFTAADYVYTMLMSSNYDYQVSEIIMEDAEYDSQTESIRLTTHFTVEGTF